MKLLVLLLCLLAPAAAQASSATSFTDSRAQTTATITVASNATTSAEVDLGGTNIVGLQMPAAFTGTTVTFLVATASGGTYQPLVDGAGSAVSKTVAASKYVGIDPTLFRGVRFVKLVSGSSEGADRAITVFSIPAK
jgi:hypothetical protein